MSMQLLVSALVSVAMVAPASPAAKPAAGAEGSATFNEKRNMMYFTRCPHEKKKAFAEAKAA